MPILTAQARETIKAHPAYWRNGDWYVGRKPITIRGYIRHHFSDGRWHGDRCGCPDDRCIGFHHDNEDDCLCLSVCLAEYVRSSWERLG